MRCLCGRAAPGGKAETTARHNRFPGNEDNAHIWAPGDRGGEVDARSVRASRYFEGKTSQDFCGTHCIEENVTIREREGVPRRVATVHDPGNLIPSCSAHTAPVIAVSSSLKPSVAERLCHTQVACPGACRSAGSYGSKREMRKHPSLPLGPSRHLCPSLRLRLSHLPYPSLRLRPSHQYPSSPLLPSSPLRLSLRLHRWLWSSPLRPSSPLQLLPLRLSLCCQPWLPLRPSNPLRLVAPHCVSYSCKPRTKIATVANMSTGVCRPLPSTARIRDVGCSGGLSGAEPLILVQAAIADPWLAFQPPAGSLRASLQDASRYRARRR